MLACAKDLSAFMYAKWIVQKAGVAKSVVYEKIMWKIYFHGMGGDSARQRQVCCCTHNQFVYDWRVASLSVGKYIFNNSLDDDLI